VCSWVSAARSHAAQALHTGIDNDDGGFKLGILMPSPSVQRRKVQVNKAVCNCAPGNVIETCILHAIDLTARVMITLTLAQKCSYCN
jgi:hypothetical protein